MSMPWNAKRELQLAKLMLERENASNLVALKGAVELKQCPKFADRYKLIATCKLGRNMNFELTEFVSKTNNATSDLFEAIASLAENMAELEQRQNDIVSDVKALRKRLSRVLATLRRRGVWVEGSIDLDVDEILSLDEWLPTLRMTVIGQDLRPETFEFEVECYDQIDNLNEIAEDVMPWQLKRENLRKIGAVGEVHPLLLCALTKRGRPIRETLASIYKNHMKIQDIFEIDGSSIVIYWKDGTLTGTFHIDNGIEFKNNNIQISDNIMKKLGLRSGRKLSEFVDLGGDYGDKLKISMITKGFLGHSVVHLVSEAVPFDKDGRLLD
ncbi:MAG: hypothetical protein VX512_12220 [Pseudomonadota bacterium]|nr:hypothetical protein [Pseudomonadota bacterium]